MCLMGKLTKKNIFIILNYALECVDSDCVALKAQEMPALIRDVQGRLIFFSFSFGTHYFIFCCLRLIGGGVNKILRHFYNNFFCIFSSLFFDEQKIKKNFFVACKKYFFISLCLLIKKILLYIMSISCIPFVGLT